MKHNRRQFLYRTGCALTMTAMATQARHFGLMSAMAQKADDEAGLNAPSDYRALVCIFMQGGNDGNNMIVPKHGGATGGVSGYSAYTTARGPQGLALTQAQLLSLNVPRIGGLEYGLHYNLGTMVGRTDVPDNNGAIGGNGTTPGLRNAGIHDLYAAGKLAFVTNVGNLVFPMTRGQYQGNQVQKPYQLFSHSDQVAQQQSARADVRSYIGWGGKIADARHLPDNPGAFVPMISSISGAQLFTTGDTTSALVLNANSALSQALTLGGFGADAASTARRTALDELRTIDLSSNVIKAASAITDQAVSASAALSGAVETTVAFPNTSLGAQLRQVARIIKKRSDLSIKRQIFYVQIGSFDTHNGQVSNSYSGQNGLLIQLGQAMRAFYDEMVQQGTQNNVTTFTMSDFGRTLNPAGSGAGVVGTDHAWGNHLMVMGGAVKPNPTTLTGDFYGMNGSNGTPYPNLALGGSDDTDGGSAPRGRWIPATSVDQYAATLARWYGVPASEMLAVFPNLDHFTTTDLGFMNP